MLFLVITSFPPPLSSYLCVFWVIFLVYALQFITAESLIRFSKLTEYFSRLKNSSVALWWHWLLAVRHRKGPGTERNRSDESKVPTTAQRKWYEEFCVREQAVTETILASYLVVHFRWLSSLLPHTRVEHRFSL